MQFSVSEYRKKRNISKTGELKTEIKSSKEKNIYVIHEHHATHLHWDLRLEMEGVLKSWAIPKSPPLAKGIKRLAIQVEDHPVDYAEFEGEIKEGYGKGTVKIWDKGNYELIKKEPKTIEISLKGKRLRGKYVLVKTNYRGKNSWLFIKID